MTVVGLFCHDVPFQYVEDVTFSKPRATLETVTPEEVSVVPASTPPQLAP